MNSEQFLFVQFCYLYSVDGGKVCFRTQHDREQEMKIFSDGKYLIYILTSALKD